MSTSWSPTNQQTITASSITDIPTISVQHKDSSIIISEATMQFIQSQCQDINALEKRAKALADCGQSESALRDASEIIRLEPSSSMGHLLAGWIHTQFGQHEAALQCYNGALRVEDNPMRCEEIDGYRRKNAQQLLKRIDFVSNLPAELLSFILPRILTISSIGDLSYLHVCRTWRQRVLQCVQLHWDRPLIVSSRVMHLLHAYASSIQRLELLCPVFYPLGVHPGTRFTSLRSLDIILDSNRSISALLTLFQSIGQTLKELSLWFNQRIRDQWIRFDDILDRFPYIELFSSRNVHLSPLRNSYSNLKSLMIKSVHKPLEENDIISLLEHLPALRHLELPRCQSSRPLGVIHKYCPTLRTLAYSMRANADTLYYDNMVIKDSGVHSLTIGAVPGFKTHDLAAILTAYSDTLVDMFVVGETTYRGDIMDLDPTVRFTCLRNVWFYLDAGEQGKELLQWILKHAPNVRALETVHFNIDDPQVYQSMEDMRNLHSLDFELPSPSLVRLLEYHASLGLESTLHILKVSSNGDHWSRTLSTISRLSTLHVLQLHLGDVTMGQALLAIMVQFFRECLSLKGLRLWCHRELPHEIIHKFHVCSNLESLTLHSPNDWGNCLLALLACPSLKVLVIPDDDLPYDVQSALGHLLVR